MQLRPHQEISREFLKQGRHRLLADEQRVGKTAPTIRAAIELKLTSVLVIAPPSVLYVWEHEAHQWGWPGTIGVGAAGAANDPDLLIVPWSQIVSGSLASVLRQRQWDVVILDESHYAKSFSAKRTQAVYGRVNGIYIDTARSICHHADRVWCLTGTPIPHDPADLYPMLRILFPETLAPVTGRYPDARSEGDYLTRYVIRKPKQISSWTRIWVNIGGRNEQELRTRIGDNMLRRRQKDVGIRPPDTALLPLPVSDQLRKTFESNVDRIGVLDAAASGNTDLLEKHLAVIRHLTGDIKARAVAPLVLDHCEGSGEKLVLAYWHKSVGDHLEQALHRLKPLRLDGATPVDRRGQMISAFRGEAQHRVFLGQIEAAGQGIDLSAAPELWFIESVFSPRAMSQMAMRIANLNATRQGLVRVAALRGSIDEAIQTSLMRLFATIEKVLED